jgi:kynurenine formamidase
MEPTLVDLSHPITDKPSCSFSLVDRVPRVAFEEGDSHGMFFITSHIDNLGSNICTHIDFPGHLMSLGPEENWMVGEYPLGRFVGPVLICDVSRLVEPVLSHFSSEGLLKIEPSDGDAILAFLKELDVAVIDCAILEEAADQAEIALSDMHGVIFRAGISEYWKYATFDSWQYAYFYNPYLSDDACRLLIEADLSFVGIDAFQLEHPIINFEGDELPVILNPGCRNYVSAKLAEVNEFANHKLLLGSDILLYENLKVPVELGGKVAQFTGIPLNLQLPNVNDNALCRPFVYLPD